MVSSSSSSNGQASGCSLSGQWEKIGFDEASPEAGSTRSSPSEQDHWEMVGGSAPSVSDAIRRLASGSNLYRESFRVSAVQNRGRCLHLPSAGGLAWGSLTKNFFRQAASGLRPGPASQVITRQRVSGLKGFSQNLALAKGAIQHLKRFNLLCFSKPSAWRRVDELKASDAQAMDARLRESADFQALLGQVCDTQIGFRLIEQLHRKFENNSERPQVISRFELCCLALYWISQQPNCPAIDLVSTLPLSQQDKMSLNESGRVCRVVDLSKPSDSQGEITPEYGTDRALGMAVQAGFSNRSLLNPEIDESLSSTHPLLMIGRKPMTGREESGKLLDAVFCDPFSGRVFTLPSLREEMDLMRFHTLGQAKLGIVYSQSAASTAG